MYLNVIWSRLNQYCAITIRIIMWIRRMTHAVCTHTCLFLTIYGLTWQTSTLQHSLPTTPPSTYCNPSHFPMSTWLIFLWYEMMYLWCHCLHHSLSCQNSYFFQVMLILCDHLYVQDQQCVMWCWYLQVPPVPLLSCGLSPRVKVYFLCHLKFSGILLIQLRGAHLGIWQVLLLRML